MQNPSFEEYISCPYFYYVQLDLASGWSSFRASPDYAHVCANTVPNVPGGHYQMPVTGNAYSAFMAYASVDNGNYREHIGSKLCDTLIIGHKYFVSINVVHAEGYLGSCNKIGVLFSTIPFGTLTITPPLPNNAHVYSNNIISDDINWTKIKGSFIADSSYKYIIIGNFFDYANTTHDNNNAYYLLDDVCVSEDSLTCYSSFSSKFLGNDTTLCFGETLMLNPTTQNSNYLWQDNSTNPIFLIQQEGLYWVKVTNGSCSVIDSINVKNKTCEIIFEIPNVFTPNRDNINEVWRCDLSSSEIVNCKIIDRWGLKIFETQNKIILWDGRNTYGIECTDGIYYYIIETEEKVYKGFVQLLR